jgi:hypothetical protein
MFRLFGLLLVGLVLAGCAEYVALELAVHAASGVSKAISSNSSSNKSSYASPKVINLIKDLGLQDTGHTRNVVKNILARDDADICTIPPKGPYYPVAVSEMKRRGLSCGVVGTPSTQIASATTTQPSTPSSRKPALVNLIDTELCEAATIGAGDTKQWDWSGWPKIYTDAAREAQRRGLGCGVGGVVDTQSMLDIEVCQKTTKLNFTGKNKVITFAEFGLNQPNPNKWDKEQQSYLSEMKRRNLSCGIGTYSYKDIWTHKVKKYTGEVDNWGVISSFGPYIPSDVKGLDGASNKDLCFLATVKLPDSTIVWSQELVWSAFLHEAKRRGLSCGVGEASTSEIVTANNSSCGPNNPQNCDSAYLCMKATNPLGNWSKKPHWSSVVQEAKRRGLDCNVGSGSNNQIGSAIITQSTTPSSAELTAAQKEAERLRQELAALKAQQEQQQSVSNDTKLPTITIASATAKGAQGIIRGRVNDNTGIAELRVDGQKIAVDSNGNFSATTYVPEGGTSVNIEAIDLAGLSSTMSVRVDRANIQTTSISFDRLNPLKRKAAINNDALALVIGVSEYKETNAKAIYADSDAKVFQDYAIEKLGVPRSRVKTLVNDGADEKDMLLATKRWLARAAKQGKTDVYIFFAGHGLASDDGSKMYLLPYDGAPELLDKTAILRDELFADISAANPRSVTVFLDTCYSGTTRGTDMLIASRPIAIRALEQSIPDNFTVMTAAAGDQTAKPLEEAKHGMFSYFLMKGMEGEADADKNNEITAGELHSYVQTNVIQQSSGSQTPELQGDADRVLVRFQ